MHETQCYDVGDDVDGVEEAKDEEKTIDAEGVEVAFEAAPTDDAVAPAETPFAEPPFDEPPYDEPAAMPFDEPAATPFDDEDDAAPLTQTTPVGNPFNEPISPFDEPTSPFDEPTTPTAIQPLAEVPTPCRRDSEIARQLHEEDAARAREADASRRRDEALAAELFENDEHEVAERRRSAATRDEALAAELLEEEERTASRKQADEALSAAAAARIASEMADAERVLEARSADDAAVARRLAGQA